jgi:hypothetical protein
VRRKQLARPAIRGIDCARTIHAPTPCLRRPAGLSGRCRRLCPRHCLRQTRGKPASSEQRLRVRAGQARRRRDARLGGRQRGTTICASDSNSQPAGAPEEAMRVWPRRRHRRRGRSAHAITWPRRLFLSSPLGTTSVPTLFLSSPQASCRLAFAALTTHSVKLAARCSRACSDRSPRPPQQNQPALVLLAQKRSRGRVRSR